MSRREVQFFHRSIAWAKARAMQWPEEAGTFRTLLHRFRELAAKARERATDPTESGTQPDV